MRLLYTNRVWPTNIVAHFLKNCANIEFLSFPRKHSCAFLHKKGDNVFQRPYKKGQEAHTEVNASCLC